MSEISVEPEYPQPDLRTSAAGSGTDRNPDGSAGGSFAEQFLNSFFQEKNIRWMLIVGAAIVFGSSLMLVTKAWPNWGHTLRYLTVLGYTAALFAVAEFGRLRLGLTATGKVLHSLTLLLLPICFLAINWLSPGTGTQNLWTSVEIIGLMIPAAAFLWFAAGRILDNLLSKRQTTFLFSYMALCVAGVLPTLSDAVAAFFFMAVCWAVFTIGVIKVNRHVFWLTEERRLPGIFGFFPVVLLGLQFLVLLGLKTVRLSAAGVVLTLPIHWIGLGCVMVAATVLLTARSVADVFRQRTGDLVRPLPWNIVVPLFSGLMLAAGGVVLSFSGFSYVGPTTYAVIPAAMLASALMALTARDTKHSGFVWAALVCLAIGYQCSPTLFADLIQRLKHGVEAAIHEQRLPFAFYGLTYLPLIIATAVGSRLFDGRGEASLSRPMKQFATGISLALFAVSVTHEKALFFVSLTNVPAFIILALIFADRRYVVPAIGALVLATGSAIPALNGMNVTSVSTDYIPASLAGLAAILTLTGLPDRLLNLISVRQNSLVRYRHPDTDALTDRSVLLQHPDGTNRSLVQLTGCFLAILTAAHWVTFALMDFSTALSPAGLMQFGFLMSALVVYTLRNPHYLSGMCVWGLLSFAAVRHAVGLQVALIDLANAASLAAAGISILCYLWLKISGQFGRSQRLNDVRQRLGLNANNLTLVVVDRNLARSWSTRIPAFVVPLCDLSLGLLAALVAGFHFPLLLKGHLALFGATVSGGVMLSTTVVVLWFCGATWLLKSRLTSVAAAVILPLWVSAELALSGFPLTATWVPFVWTVVAATVLFTARRLAERTGFESVGKVLAIVSEGWLQCILVISCLSFGLPLRLAGCACLVCFLWVDRHCLTAPQRSYFAIVGSIHVVLIAAALGGAAGSILTPAGVFVLPAVFLTIAVAAVLFDSAGGRFDPVIMKTWGALLRPVIFGLAVVSFHGQPYLPVGQALMLVGFGFAVFAEVLAAVRTQQEQRVWNSCVVVVLSGVFLYDQKIVQFGAGTSQFVLLAIAVVALVIVKLSERHSKLSIMQRPMNTVAHSLPMLVTAMAVVRAMSGLPTTFRAANSLALLMAAGIYFHLGMVTRKRRYGLLSAAIVNTALMLLWRSLNLTQPELYLVPVGLTILTFVELLKKELPESSHDPLRYLGALTILVSPVFDLFGESWIPAISLMVLSVAVILLAIGLRLRALVYTGSAFLAADLIAMIIRSRIDYPFVPWLCGIALGLGVIAFAAFCENHREKVMARIRLLSAELATWR